MAASRRQGSDVERGGRRARRGRAANNIRPRRNSILQDNVCSLTPVREEDEDVFVFTITNSRGESRAITADDRRTIAGNRPRDILSDAQRVGSDAPPTYDQVVIETSRRS